MPVDLIEIDAAGAWRDRTVVYTCVVGNYDHLGVQEFQDGVDYIFFTDGKCEPPEDRWRVEQLPDLSHLHPRRAAKLPKLHPHLFPVLSEYRYSIWIDGDMQIKHPNFVGEFLDFIGDDPLLLTPHFDGRDCAYGEATIRPPKYASEPLDAQVAFYHQDGFPEHTGLYEGGVIGRRMDCPEVADLGELWLLQNLLWSYQDQVSLPYCLWKLGLEPEVLPKSFRDFDWIHINAHRHEL